MTVLSYQSLYNRCKYRALVAPLSERTVVNGKTYGLSSCGYDIRVAQQHILAPGDFTLASSVEHFQMPDDLVAMVHDKSSWARQGLAVQNTVLEPGWRGYLTIELSNHGKETLTIMQGDPIAQVIFHQLDQPTQKEYAGKYQDQEAGPQPARFEK